MASYFKTMKIRFLFNVTGKRLICIILLFISRTFTHEELLEQAEKNYVKMRNQHAEDMHDLLVPHIQGIWGSNAPLNKETITRKVAKENPRRNDPRRDEKMLKAFLDNINPKVLEIPDLVRNEDILQTGTTVLDMVRCIQNKEAAWKYPSKETLNVWSSKRAVSWESLTDVDIREVYIGTSTESEVEDFTVWVKSQHEKNQKEFPTEILSFDVEEIRISRFDYTRIVSKEYQGKSIILAKELNIVPKKDEEMMRGKIDRWTNLPTKIMFGDGVSWLALISFPIEKYGKNYSVKIRPVQEKLIDLIESLPIVTGVGIKPDVDMIESLFSDLAVRTVRMKGYVDLGVMAVLAGWRLEATNMTALALIGLGTVMNKISSIADGAWGLKFDTLPKQFQIYALSDITVGHLLYSTFLYALIHELFPDPEAACYTTRTIQKDFIHYIAVWITSIVKETTIYLPDRNAAATRKDLVRSIKTYTSLGKVSKYCPSKLKDFLALLDRNPTIMYGGPRFLHSVRQKMISQYAVLKATAVPFEKDLFERELQAEEKQYLRCGHKGIRECNHWEPVDIIDWKKSLSIHPKLAPKRFRIKMDELSIDHLLREASFRERGIREGVFEFFRMNMKLIDVFFDACNEDSVFGRTYRKFYEKLRLIDRTETRARIMSFIYADQQPDPSGLTPVKRYRERRTMRERSRSRSRPRGATLEEKVREHDQEEQLVVL